MGNILGKIYFALTIALTALFIGLKLAEYITWSWWLVTAPVSLNVVFALAICGLASFLQQINKPFD